jgi:hypothetical protein
MLILIIVVCSVAYNFEIGNNKSKLRTEYESLTEEVLLRTESNFLSYTFIFCKQFYFVISSFKIYRPREP